MGSQFRRICKKVLRTMDSISLPEFLLLNILLTGLLLLPQSKFTPIEYILGIIKLGIVYGWFVFLMVLLSFLVDVPNRLDVSISDWVASIVTFGVITSFVLWEYQCSVILKVLILVPITVLWSYLTIRILRHIQKKSYREDDAYG